MHERIPLPLRMAEASSSDSDNESSSGASSASSSSGDVQLTPYASDDDGSDSDRLEEDMSTNFYSGGHPPWRGHGDKLVGIVDMGSNGIRFSISDLSASMCRILPTVLMYRSGLSLYDAQFDPETGTKIPIPGRTIRRQDPFRRHRSHTRCRKLG
ncbi:Retrograde regulation protein 2 like [Verticillium longisporum]|nr:Retrograde regulation protein 2 like [Verticillium longisporum]